jgi:hypothetical protein
MSTLTDKKILSIKPERERLRVDFIKKIGSNLINGAL